MWSARSRLLSLLAFSIALAACGGDSSSDSIPTIKSGIPVPEAEGVWNGYSDDAGTDMLVVILENGEFWSLNTDSPNQDVWGFVHGHVTIASASGFTVPDAREMGVGSSGDEGTIDATLQPKVSILGHFVSAVNGRNGAPLSWNFGLSPIPEALYRYAVPASTADALGAWAGRFWGSSWEGPQLGSGPYDRAGPQVFIALASDGAFSGTVMACTFSGTIQPRASGKNVFDTTITMATASGSAACPDVGLVASGIGLIYRLQDGRQRLVVAAKDADRNKGVLFFADR